MTNEEKQIHLRRPHDKEAIALAMQSKWAEAIEANKKIIEAFPNDVDAHNRLGRAFMEVGEYSAAKDAYSRALELDPANTIAQKNLHRLSQLQSKAVVAQGNSHHVEPQHFIEEMGKAGVVNLTHLAPPAVLVGAVAGDEVHLKVDGTRLVVEDAQGEYLGQVEPKHAQRLIKLMEGGNKYTAAVVSSDENRLTTIIREVYQHPSQAGQLSFPPRGAEKLQPFGRILQQDEEERDLLAESQELYGEPSSEE